MKDCTDEGTDVVDKHIVDASILTSEFKNNNKDDNSITKGDDNDDDKDNDNDDCSGNDNLKTLVRNTQSLMMYLNPMMMMTVMARTCLGW